MPRQQTRRNVERDLDLTNEEAVIEAFGQVSDGVSNPTLLTMSRFLELDEALGGVNESLSFVDEVVSAVIRVEIDGTQVTAIFNGENWGIQLGG